MTVRRALITGITGQDGSYLAELLLSQGYEVHGMVRRLSADNWERLAHIQDQLHLHSGDLLDSTSLVNLLRDVRPREIYNLAAQSFVPASWQQPILTGEITGLGATRVLEAILQVDKGIRFYQRLVPANPAMARRIIFVTGDVAGTEAESFLQDSGCRWLAKPFRLGELLLAARDALA